MSTIFHNFLIRKYVIIIVLCLVGCECTKVYNRNSFPTDFIFGSGTSAYQVEGAAFEDGRKASIFDTFAHSSGREGDGDKACGGYYKYKEDVQLMVETGLEAYRFSISWSRLIPDGRGPVNPKGVQYYNNLINELISHGIEPHVTLMHLDTPSALEEEYEGFLNQNIIEDFTAYADVCFREFGDRVRHWITINEPNIFMMGGYDTGNSPPARCSSPFGLSHCTKGNSTIEPYIGAHNVLLAHASTWTLYKEKYQGTQHGFVGFNLYAFGFIPYSDTEEDKSATQRAYDFFIGWFMHPLVYGDYPEIMKAYVGSKIPAFSKDQSELVKGSFDFIGLNYYTVILAQHTALIPEPSDYLSDNGVNWIYYGDSSPLTTLSYPVLPWGMQVVLEYFKNVYNNPPIYIQENGQLASHKTAVNDPLRVSYLQGLIGGVLDAARNGSNVKGYFVWSFMDVYELVTTGDLSFGLYYVNFSDPNLSRYPKLSQNWYSGFLKGANVTIDDQSSKSNVFPVDSRLSAVIADDPVPLKDV